MQYEVIHKTGSTSRIATPPENDRARAIESVHKNSVKFGRVIFELCERTDRHTDILKLRLPPYGEGTTII